eukprot:365077-Chlamydomonas_euryale.AAC.10
MPMLSVARQRGSSNGLGACHNGAGRHCEIVTRLVIDDVLRYREYGPASRRYSRCHKRCGSLLKGAIAHGPEPPHTNPIPPTGT